MLEGGRSSTRTCVSLGGCSGTTCQQGLIAKGLVGPRPEGISAELLGSSNMAAPVAAPVLTDEQKRTALAGASADFLFMMGKQDITDDNQAIICHLGVNTVEKFANIATDRADLVNFLRDHVGLDATAALASRVQVASIVCAWRNANTRVEKTAEIEAEAGTKEFTKPIVNSEWMAMRSGLERIEGRVEDKALPSKEYLEKKLQEIEAGDYRAESLTEVVSKDEVDPDALHPQWDIKGTLTIRRGASKVEEPQTPEALRRRLTVMQHAFQMVSLRHTNRPELQGDYVKAFAEFKDYLLEEYVYGLNSQDEQGRTVATPPWALILSYERAVRKEAMKRTNADGIPIPVALKQAWKDPTIKERHFVTPLALHMKRPQLQNVNENPNKWQKHEEKGKGKGKGKKGKSALPNCASHMPDGTPICYRFNTPGEKCKERKCKFKHACGQCFGSHPLFKCKAENKQPQDTQGTGS